jgi:hypothetical protein
MKQTDLDTAVAEGIVTEVQAAQLRELAQRQERERAIALGHEERFRFMRGFNDVFFAIGVVLFLLGVGYFMPPGTTGTVLMAALVWGLAEILIGRLRLVLPGILLAIAFVTLVTAASVGLPVEGRLGGGIAWHLPTDWSLLQMLQNYPGGPLAFTVRALVPALAAAAFYWRFKLPFALLPLAVSLAIAALGVASFLFPGAPAVADTVFSLVCGLAVFVAAMRFDMSDRERLTRRADCAFWLHLVAAPLIVRSAMSLTAAPAVAVIAIVAALAVVALLIDRRALLVSGLAYLGGAIGYILSGDSLSVLAATLVILGAIVLTLGAGWVPLRRRLLALVSPAIANRLPPVPARP